MKKGNKAVIIVIVLVLVIALLVGGAWAVNEFVINNPKDLFDRYTMQNLSEVFSFDTSFISQIENDNSGKTRQTKTDIEIFGEDGIKVETDLRVDKQNNKSQIDIDLKTKDTSVLKIQGLRNGEKYAFKSDSIANGYIGIENNKLDELAEKLGIEMEGIPNKIEFTKGDFENNKKKILSKLQEEYLPIITNKFADDKYTKEKNITVRIDDIEYAKATKLTLNTDVKEISNLLIELVEKAKNDEELFEKIMTYGVDGYDNEIKKLYEETLDSLKESLEEVDSDETIKINTYIEKNKVIKTDIVFEDGGSISIYKGGDTKRIILDIASSEDISDIADIDEDIKKVELAIKDKLEDDTQELNVQVSVNNEEMYVIDMEINKIEDGSNVDIEFSDNSEYPIKINIETEYKDSVEVTNLEDNNYMILNEHSKEELETFMGQLGPVVEETVQEAMIKLLSNVMGSIYSNLPDNSSEVLQSQNDESSEDESAEDINEDAENS